MPEPTLIQEQRAILRRLRQMMVQHSQITTDADAQWREVQRAYEEVRARLEAVGEEQTLRSAATRPPTATPGADPAEAFRHSAGRALQDGQKAARLPPQPEQLRMDYGEGMP